MVSFLRTVGAGRSDHQAHALMCNLPTWRVRWALWAVLPVAVWLCTHTLTRIGDIAIRWPTVMDDILDTLTTCIDREGMQNPKARILCVSSLVVATKNPAHKWLSSPHVVQGNDHGVLDVYRTGRRRRRIDKHPLRSLPQELPELGSAARIRESGRTAAFEVVVQTVVLVLVYLNVVVALRPPPTPPLAARVRGIVRKVHLRMRVINALAVLHLPHAGRQKSGVDPDGGILGAVAIVPTFNKHLAVVRFTTPSQNRLTADIQGRTAVEQPGVGGMCQGSGRGESQQ